MPSNNLFNDARMTTAKQTQNTFAPSIARSQSRTAAAESSMNRDLKTKIGSAAHAASSPATQATTMTGSSSSGLENLVGRLFEDPNEENVAETGRFGLMACLRIEPRHPVGEHPASAHLAVIIGHDVVGALAQRRA